MTTTSSSLFPASALATATEHSTVPWGAPVHAPYRVLARTYRPLFFREVLGQEIFVRMIQNALSSGRAAHGFLLTGIRGIGKTTLARLIAKALCCEKLAASVGQQHVPAEMEPCGTCPSCTALQEDRHLDIVELDAASHTGIDDIRLISESSGYRPVMAPYRIYIIDEVHMLSKNAFNALLKTLEEPLPHVKFILATTEMSKVPLTVVSRCQHIPLKPLPLGTLCHLLRGICEKEGVTWEEDALETLGLYAEGGARDALSLLERAILATAQKRHITLVDVVGILGLSPREHLVVLLEQIFHQKIPEALHTVRELDAQGVEPSMILLGLLDGLYHITLHHLGVAPAKGGPWESLHRLFPQTDMAQTTRLWTMAQRSLPDLHVAPFPFMALEMIVVRLSYMGRFPSPTELLNAWKEGKTGGALPAVLQGHPLVQKAQELFPDAVFEALEAL